MWERLKIVGVVTLMTLLIWLWAETESLQTSQLAARVRILETRSLTPGIPPTAEVVDPPDWNGLVKLTIGGSNVGIRGAQRDLDGERFISVTELGIDVGPSERVIDLTTYFRELPALARRGIIVTSVDPPTLRVRITPPPGAIGR
jgi:hypothetical protein